MSKLEKLTAQRNREKRDANKGFFQKMREAVGLGGKMYGGAINNAENVINAGFSDIMTMYGSGMKEIAMAHAGFAGGAIDARKKAMEAMSNGSKNVSNAVDTANKKTKEAFENAQAKTVKYKNDINKVASNTIQGVFDAINTVDAMIIKAKENNPGAVYALVEEQKALKQKAEGLTKVAKAAMQDASVQVNSTQGNMQKVIANADQINMQQMNQGGLLAPNAMAGLLI